jgi:hypothetical protein
MAVEGRQFFGSRFRLGGRSAKSDLLYQNSIATPAALPLCGHIVNQQIRYLPF